MNHGKQKKDRITCSRRLRRRSPESKSTEPWKKRQARMTVGRIDFEVAVLPETLGRLSMGRLRVALQTFCGERAKRSGASELFRRAKRAVILFLASGFWLFFFLASAFCFGLRLWLFLALASAFLRGLAWLGFCLGFFGCCVLALAWFLFFFA